MIVRSIKWIMLVSGALTCTMFKAAFAPAATLESMFGASLQGPVADVVVRSWGVLIGLIGVLLIYAAFRPAVRAPILVVAGASKLVFIALVICYGLVGGQARVALVSDGIMVALFAICLVAARSHPPASS